MKRNNTPFNLTTLPFKALSSIGYISKKIFLSWTRLIVWTLQVPKRPYMLFATRIIALWSNSGPTFVVNYLKESTRIVQAYVSGNPIYSTSIPISLRGGLPTIIPGCLRTDIRSNNLVSIRGVLSVLAAYRVIKIPGKIKLSTITDPFKGVSTTLFKDEVRVGLGELHRIFTPLNFRPISLNLRRTAGPNSSVSMLGIWSDIWTWKDSPLFQDLRSYCSSFPGGVEFLQLIDSEISFLESIGYSEKGKLGKLAEKEEAAGKVRIFAITDSLTQSIFRPLSDSIFSVLKSLPMDGTFDQDSPIRHLLSLKDEWIGATIYSYDLSAATDRLPIDLQVQVLSFLIGDKLALAWSNILTKRDWIFKGIPYRYSVGQPMGALSSWAMLALTHHVIVRIAANRVGIQDFTHYALLGDDIVIANESVAKSYHYLMTVTLGVEINLSKSLVSKHSFEFAKRLITLDGEVSPVGAKNVLVGLKSISSLPGLVLDAYNKGVTFTLESVDKMFSNVPTVRKTRAAVLKQFVTGPFGFIYPGDGLQDSSKLGNSQVPGSEHSTLVDVCQTRLNLDLSVWKGNMRKTDTLICNWLSLTSIPGIDDSRLQESPVYLVILDHYWSKAGQLIKDKPQFFPVSEENWVSDNGESLRFTPDYAITLIPGSINSKMNATFSAIDPFETGRAILPMNEVYSPENFWVEYAVVKQRSSFRPTWWAWYQFKMVSGSNRSST